MELKRNSGRIRNESKHLAVWCGLYLNCLRQERAEGGIRFSFDRVRRLTFKADGQENSNHLRIRQD